MKINILRSVERKVSEFKEVEIKHNFNYGSFFNPLREKFGVLRVLNDEQLAPGFCFNERFHKNIELLLFPLSGSINCKDSTGRNISTDNKSAMLISTGSGLSYSICNSSHDQGAEVIELWIFAVKNDCLPDMTVLETPRLDRTGKMQLIASGEKSGKCLTLKQNAFVWRIDLSVNESVTYDLKVKRNILLIFVVKGTISVNNDDETEANERDSIELTDIKSEIIIKAVKESELFIIEVPID